jgi:mRNA-degrading endonuclease RelE of RelBE toxin-antitoxin system
MPYSLRRYRKVRDQIRQTPTRIRDDIKAIISDLANDPRPSTAEPLRDQFAGILKIKADGWRIFYRVNEQDRIVIVIAVKRRTRDTYKSIP